MPTRKAQHRVQAGAAFLVETGLRELRIVSGDAFGPGEIAHARGVDRPTGLHTPRRAVAISRTPALDDEVPVRPGVERAGGADREHVGAVHRVCGVPRNLLAVAELCCGVLRRPWAGTTGRGERIGQPERHAIEVTAQVSDTGDEMVIVADAPALMEKLEGSALRLPALLAACAACGSARSWRCAGSASISTAR
jgi:hypothetical protein